MNAETVANRPPLRRFLFIMPGVVPFTFYAESRAAARDYGLEQLGFVPGMPAPRCTAVPVA